MDMLIILVYIVCKMPWKRDANSDAFKCKQKTEWLDVGLSFFLFALHIYDKNYLSIHRSEQELHTNSSEYKEHAEYFF